MYSVHVAVVYGALCVCGWPAYFSDFSRIVHVHVYGVAQTTHTVCTC